MRQAQIAPLNRNARTRRSADNVWPLRGADGLTFAERKARDAGSDTGSRNDRY